VGPFGRARNRRALLSRLSRMPEREGNRLARVTLSPLLLGTPPPRAPHSASPPASRDQRPAKEPIGRERLRPPPGPAEVHAKRPRSTTTGPSRSMRFAVAARSPRMMIVCSSLHRTQSTASSRRNNPGRRRRCSVNGHHRRPMVPRLGSRIDRRASAREIVRSTASGGIVPSDRAKRARRRSAARDTDEATKARRVHPVNVAWSSQRTDAGTRGTDGP